VFKIGLLHSTAEKCSAGTTETRSIGTNEKAKWTAPLKKLYCFTCATERIGLLQWCHWKMLCWHLWNSCAGTAEKKNQTGEEISRHHWNNRTALTGAAEKCSAGASETAVLALLKKKIKLVKKLYCFTFATEKNLQASLKNRTAPLAPEKCSAGASETRSAGTA